MDAIKVLQDLVARPSQALDNFWDDLDPSRLNNHPGGHPNSIAWLIWHTARETDAQIAPLADQEQVWTADGFDARFGLTDVHRGTGEVGLGQSAEQARAVTVEATPEGKRLLREYLDPVYAMATRWIATLNETELDRVIDDQFDPRVTLGIRVISVLDDVTQHIEQTASPAVTVEETAPTR